jgi:hypothetical protein
MPGGLVRLRIIASSAACKQRDRKVSALWDSFYTSKESHKIISFCLSEYHFAENDSQDAMMSSLPA